MKFLKTFLASLTGTIAAMFVAFLLLFVVVGSLLSLGSSEPVVPEKAVLTIDLSSGLSEQSSEDIQGLLTGQGVAQTLGLYKAIRAIDMAATDPAIPYIYLKCDNHVMSLTQMEEVRNALSRFRQSGKPILAYADNYSQGSLYLATVADKIYTAPLSSPTILGLSSQILFLKDMLDKLGVDIQLIRHGKYKSAGEQFIASDISDANREQQEAYLKGMWNTIAGPICESRNLDVNEFNRMINNMELNTAEDLIRVNLIDAVVTREELKEKLETLYEVAEDEEVAYVDLTTYANAKVVDDFTATDKIAILYADGQINGADGEGITTNPMVEEIRKIREDDDIKAVVLRVNSPGGNAQTAEIIRKELRLLAEEKPMIASYGDYAASGGYWISAEVETIFTNATTLTGSIGVFSMIPSVGNAVRKHTHINPVSINTHKHSDMGLMRKLDHQERANFQKSVDDIYNNFIQIVADGRGMTTEAVDKIAQGRVWCGQDAIGINLADKIGGLKEAVEYAAIVAKLEAYRTVEFPKEKSGIEKLMDSFANTSAALDVLSDPQQLSERLLEEANARTVQARLPYVILHTNL